jgi:hypothetical protein
MVIMIATGRLLVALKRPTPPEASPATPIWKKSSSPDALPTFFENGARERAMALGFESPSEDKAIKNNIIVSVRP